MSNGDICYEAGQGKESDGDVALDLRWDHQQGPFDKGTLSRAWRKQEGALLGPGRGGGEVPNRRNSEGKGRNA